MHPLVVLSFVPPPYFSFMSLISWACLNPSWVEPSIYPLQLDHPFTRRRPSSSVLLLHILPCIEHRYVPLLGTSLLSYDTRFLLILYYKQFYYFSIFPIWKILKIKKKHKNLDEKLYYFLLGIHRVRSPSNKALHIPSIGWVISMNLGVVLVTLSSLHQLVMLPVPMEPLSIPSVS